MSDANLRQIRVLHIVSAGGVAASLQPSLFMPLLTRLPRQRVKSQVACLSPGAVPSAVLRQNGVPTFDLALSRKRFSPKAFNELMLSTRHFRPDVIQAWGHTAQVIAALLRKRCEWKPRLVWSVSDTVPIAKNAGLIDRQKLKYAAKLASRADRIVYTSEASASQHRRVGFPDGGHETIPPGVDATRFKPDFAARRKLREELSLPGETFVVGMAAPFQPEFDHATLIKAVGELVKTNPNIAVVLAGHGVQKGNAPLMALVGGGSMATRVHLLGEWSDISALYNACDVVCSSATNDQSRMNIVMAMLCGVPCVATGMGAQGEIIGQHGVAIEAGSPTAFVKGITRVMQMTAEKRTHMAQGARKHALSNYVYVKSLQKYLQLYYDLIGRQSLVGKDLPTPEIDEALTVPPALPTEAEMNAGKRKPVTLVDLSDPESLESKVTEKDLEELPKWRIEQEQERNKREAELAAQVAASKSVGDVLQVFESQVKASASETPMTERARGVADDSEELLPQELLESDAPAPPRISSGPSVVKKPSAASPSPSAPPRDAAKEAALKAARMAALQPIAPAQKAASKSPTTRPPATPIPEASKPLTRPPVSSPTTRPPATPIAEPAKADINSTQPLGTLAQELANTALPPGTDATAPTKAEPCKPEPAKADIKPDFTQTQSLELPSDILPPGALTTNRTVETPAAAEQAPKANSPSVTEFGELTLLATGEWMAMQRSDAKSEPKADSAQAESTKGESTKAPSAKTASSVKADTAKLDAVKSDSAKEVAAKAADTGTHELNGPETLSLISTPVPATETEASAEPTLQLALLPDAEAASPAVEPKRAANDK